MTKKQSEVKQKRGKILFTQPSMTKQSFAQETNVNAIMARYEKTGIIDHISKHGGSYGDFSNTPTYQEAQNKIMLAQNMFSELPSHIRKHFNNDPAEFIEFTSHPENIDKLVDLGLAKLKPSEPQEPEATPTPSQPTKEPVKPSFDPSD